MLCWDQANITSMVLALKCKLYYTYLYRGQVGRQEDRQTGTQAPVHAGGLAGKYLEAIDQVISC